MSPAFPQFKYLELSDKAAIEGLTRYYPPYSDFEFASLWAWNVKEEIQWCLCGTALVVRFTDYNTGQPFFTFLGKGAVSALAEELLALSAAEGYGATLAMVPEISARSVDAGRFCIQEAREHFDYIYELDRYVTYAGRKLKARRNFLNGFLKQYPGYTAETLDLSSPRVRSEIDDLWSRWQHNRGSENPNERRAYERFLLASSRFDCVVTGVFVEGALAAFNITALMPGVCGNALFEKADTRFHGIYPALMHEVAMSLLSRGRKQLNYEQDLGIESLRRAKLAFDPVNFLKKFTIRNLDASCIAKQPPQASVGLIPAKLRTCPDCARLEQFSAWSNRHRD